MKLYIANKNYSSWSLRPWVLLRMLDIPFTEVLEPFGASAGETAARFRTFSPTARVPCLHDGPLQVWDSLAIVEYLAERFPAVWPTEAAARTWARCAAAEMHSGFGGAAFTAVDAFFAPVAFRLQSYGLSLGPAGDAYRDRLLALPPMRQWYEAALREPWREVAHEAAIATHALSITDLRQPAA